LVIGLAVRQGAIVSMKKFRVSVRPSQSLRRFPMKRYIPILLILVLGMVACVPTKVAPEKAIVGKWVNLQGGEMNFYGDGTGLFPGIEGQIPEYQFNYFFKDETHVAINIPGVIEVVVEVKIDGDEMTWYDRSSETEFVYMRAK
jgi:hypothetical protein